MVEDYSSGTEAFRDALLKRCLNELDAEAGTPLEEDALELPDEALELLAAAGDLFTNLQGQQ